MISSTSNSSVKNMKWNRLVGLYFLTALMVFGGLALLGSARYLNKPGEGAVEESVPSLISRLPKMHVNGREVGNQMLIHNVALFSRYPTPALVRVGYVGTSRSKVLRPEHFGLASAVVGAGNSYNEISYGLLLQAEILRLRFPHLRRVYFETSMLLRRPATLMLEEDHRKYLPLLKDLLPLILQLPMGRSFERGLSASQQQGAQKLWHRELLRNRASLRFSYLFSENKENMVVLDDPLLAELKPNGERKSLSKALTPKVDQILPITNDHIKVQRLRSILSNAPWDGLFDLIALWGRKYGIEVIFFQPPVRSDLYRFQVEYGLGEHAADIERVSHEYAVPFFDLNRPELGYMNDWSLFSDEDHMETCLGSGLLTLALEEGYNRFRAVGERRPQVEKIQIESTYADRLNNCSD